MSTQWEPITGPSEFVDALTSFFAATEREMASRPEFEGLADEIAAAITQLIGHIKTPEFMETALMRMARAHGAPR